ncbi:PREDICTED: uncharacterized protein LOC109588559 isoform X2 [Amphimedon queenslandica]|uniref:Death domain-containing protein n=1 Tax=Amphimedon queenslandica TaxID=400682 RepID=A0AAN0JTP6_AMPQE|nr:PREDICTED: uncharacterized protein LOC109588559 isoform X2 [Amphimedon queenslandica]|eukprot:XP_019860273.1 PREDICTED: uncharacterized protein LOC109588559 isoform X2 [Amphimedon queenslandica]
MATQHKKSSYNSFLSATPTIKELTEYVDVSTNWYIVGTMLDLDQKRLRSIKERGGSDTDKIIEMFNLWLTTTPTASRKQVLETLRKKVVGENTLADEYEKHLKELHEATYTPPSTEAVYVLQSNIQSLNEALVSPVQVSQLLYCKGCISEATLDEMERIDQSRSLDDKKTTLLTAIQETVSSDYRKLKDIATVLSDVEETRDIANEIMSNVENMPEEEDQVVQLFTQEMGSSDESHASNVLRNNYSALSQSITEPVRMARLLHEEVISDEALSRVISTRGSVSDSRAVLLKAVRGAVHSNYKHLELFVTVLRKFSKTAHIGDAIFEAYTKHFNYYDEYSEEAEIHLAEIPVDVMSEENSQLKSMPTSSSLDDKEINEHNDNKILFPRDMRNKFMKMRRKFGSTVLKVCHKFVCRENVLNIDEMKELISDWFPDLKPQLSYKNTVGEVLKVLKRKCSIIDISPLEDLASEFDIEEAKPIIKSFKEEAKNFCKSVSVSLCLDEKLQAVATPSRLLCETVVFVFNWDPDEHTLQDINDVLFELEPLHKCHIQMDKVGTGQSVVVACYCATEYTGLLIMDVLGMMDTLQRKGLKEFIVGNFTLWNATQVVSKNTVVTDILVQINDLKAALRDRDEKIMATETELAAFMELSENRLKEIEAVKIDLYKSQRINVQKEEVITELKEKISILFEEVIEKENLLKQYLEETDSEESSYEGVPEADESLDTSTSKSSYEEVPEADESLNTSTSIQEDGEVEWSQDGVHLLNPSVDQCMEVITKLEDKHEIMTLTDSSSDSIQFLIPTILEGRTIKRLVVLSAFLTHDDILSFIFQLSTNKSLTMLQISNDSISDDGVVALAQSLQYNETLEYLQLQYNRGITSACAQSIAKLLNSNKTLTYLNLYDTNIDSHGAVILSESLQTNNTLNLLWLDRQHKDTCSALPYFEQIKNRLNFW